MRSRWKTYEFPLLVGVVREDLAILEWREVDEPAAELKRLVVQPGHVLSLESCNRYQFLTLVDFHKNKTNLEKDLCRTTHGSCSSAKSCTVSRAQLHWEYEQFRTRSWRGRMIATFQQSMDGLVTRNMSNLARQMGTSETHLW